MRPGFVLGSPASHNSVADRLGFGQLIMAAPRLTIDQDIVGAVARYNLSVPAYLHSLVHGFALVFD